jgi:hypothetical protein
MDVDGMAIHVAMRKRPKEVGAIVNKVKEEIEIQTPLFFSPYATFNSKSLFSKEQLYPGFGLLSKHRQ